MPYDGGYYREHGFEHYAHDPIPAHDKLVGKYNGDTRDFQFNGYGRLQHEKSIYEGEFKNGKYDGTGKLYIDNELIYEGQFKNDLFHGYGKELIWKNNSYEGEYIHGKKVKGKLITERYIYIGGFGIEHVFRDYYVFNGEGILYYNENGEISEVYSGIWINGMPHSDGIWTSYTSSIQVDYEEDDDDDIKEYIGHFEQGLFISDTHKMKFKVNINSFGIIELDISLLYKGTIINGKREGKGYEYNEFSKLIYEGEFKDNVRHGKGIEYKDTKKINWKKDDFIFRGNFLNGIREGFGRSFTTNGDLEYEGEWANNKYHGKGTYHINERTTFKYDMLDGHWVHANFVSGKRFFKGKLFDEGQYKDNILIYGYRYSYNSNHSYPVIVEKYENKYGTTIKIIGRIYDYDFDKGFGFFIPKDYNHGKVFFHIKEVGIKIEDSYSLGDIYLVDVDKTERGLRAINVKNYLN